MRTTTTHGASRESKGRHGQRNAFNAITYPLNTSAEFSADDRTSQFREPFWLLHEERGMNTVLIRRSFTFGSFASLCSIKTLFALASLICKRKQQTRALYDVRVVIENLHI